MVFHLNGVSMKFQGRFKKVYGCFKEYWGVFWGRHFKEVQGVFQKSFKGELIKIEGCLKGALSFFSREF